jgi:outer membrane cobalamin receptor
MASWPWGIWFSTAPARRSKTLLPVHLQGGAEAPHPKTPLGGAQLVLAALMMLLSSSSAWPQQEVVRHIPGLVVDQSGLPVPRVLIEVRSQSGRTEASALTDSQGKFILNLPDGNYTLDATASGLAPLRRQPLEVGAATAPLRLTLEVPSIVEKIVVTATRTEAPLAQVGSSTTVIHGNELELEGTDSVVDALRHVAGVTIAQSGGNGQLSSLFIRGGESDYTKVLIDGIPVNDPGGSFNFANLSVSSIDRIEIVRGPQSALFGSDAMAGVIQIFTHRGTSEGLEPRPRISFEGGGLATFRYETGIEGKGERLDYSASFARLDTDNKVRNGSFNDETATGNLGLRLSQKSRLRAVFRSDAGRTGVPGQWAFYRPDSDQYYRHRDLAGGVTFTHFTMPSWTQTLSYAINDSRQFSEDAVDDGSFVARYQGHASPFTSFDFPYQTLNQSRRQKIDYQSEWSLPHAHLLTAGAEFERETGFVGDPRSDPPAAKRENLSVFIQDQWFLKRFFAAVGMLQEWRLERNRIVRFPPVPRLSLAWHAHAPSQGGLLGLTKIRANFGRGIKEPTLVESFSKSPFFLGNPNLKAEKSVSYDVGIEQDFRGGKGAVELAYFESRFSNQIGFVTTDYTTFAGTFFNLAKTRARGIETDFRQKLGWGLELSGSYTLLDGLVVENPAPPDPVYAPGQPLLRRPRHSGYLDLKWRPGRWTLGATGTFVGRRLDSDFLGLGLNRNPGYGMLDLLLSFRLFSGATVFAVVNNALDKGYMEVLGYPALPARFRIGLSAGF